MSCHTPNLQLLKTRYHRLRHLQPGAHHRPHPRGKLLRPILEFGLTFCRTYSRGVSFDTFDNRDATDFSFTLNYKHKNYHHSRRSRTFLCGTDQKDYSEFALEWLIDELVDDGDEIICLRAVDKDSKLVTDATVDKNKYRQEAQKLLNQVVAKNAQEEKAISIVLELAVGKVQDIIQRMVRDTVPDLGRW